MGWCSGTDVFDRVARAILVSDASAQSREDLLLALVDALEDQDWDCQQDSDFYSDTTVQTVMRRLHPDWFEEQES